MRDKLKNTLANWAQNSVKTTEELRALEISHANLQKWRASGWIQEAGRGAVYRTGDKPSWENVVEALQRNGFHLHLGGRSALELAGLAHYVRGTGKPVFLFSLNSKAKLPSWAQAFQVNAKLGLVAKNLFSSKGENLGLTEYSAQGTKLKGSSPERALLEVADQVYDEHSYQEAKELMKALTSPRVELTQNLLQECKSIKAKRLFLHLARTAGFQWVDKLDISKFDLGSGPREIVKHGKYDPEFNLIVPDNEEN